MSEITPATVQLELLLFAAFCYLPGVFAQIHRITEGNLYSQVWILFSSSLCSLAFSRIPAIADSFLMLSHMQSFNRQSSGSCYDMKVTFPPHRF